MTTTIVSSGTAPVTPSVTSEGDYLVVLAGGTALSATIDGGSERILGVDSAGTVTGAGFVGVSSGATAIGTLLTDSTTETVLGEGTALSITVQSGASEIVWQGGSAAAVLVSAGGFMALSAGHASGLTLLSGGSAVVEGYTYSSGSGIAVASSVVSGLTVSSGGFAVLSFGGVVQSGDVADGGLVIVQSGASAVALTLAAGGAAIVEPGAHASTTGAGSAYARGVVVTRTGDGVIAAGTVITGSSFDTGEQVFVLPGGTATGNVFSGGASEAVFSGGTAAAETIAGGFEVVSSGGFATGTVLESGAVQYVFSGGSALGTVVASGYSIVDSGGTATSTTVESGANQSLDGIARATLLESGGGQYVDAGGTAVSTLIEGGAYAYVYGALNSAAVSGYAVIGSSGTARADDVASGAVLVADSATNVVGGTVSSGGVLVIERGAVDSGTTIASGGTLILLPHGVAEDVSSSSGATEISGGEVVVISGGTAASLAGGSTSGLPLGSGNTAFVLSGATATNTDIGAFAAVVVAGSGTANGALISGGGTLIISSGATVTGAVSFVDSGGTIVVSQAMTSSVVSNFAVGDDILVNQSGTAASAVLSSGNALVISNETGSTTIQLDPTADYTGDVFSAQSANGLTEVTIAPPPPTPAGTGSAATPVDIPLYLVNVGDGYYRVGIEVSLNGGASYQMYLFDAGADGFYAAYTPANWTGYTLNDENPAIISYAAGTTLIAQSVSTDVTLQTTSGGTLSLGDSTVGLITAVNGSIGTPQSWNAGLASDPATGEFAGQFFGDFGVDLTAGRAGIDNLLPQIAGLDDGFIINLGSFPDDATGQIGTLQIGLTAADIASYSTLVPMQGINTVATFANSGEPSYAQALTSGTVVLTSGTQSFTTSAGFIYDTGSPEIVLEEPSSVISGALSSFLDGERVVDGTTVTLTAPGLESESWVVGVAAGDIPADNLVLAKEGDGDVNVGLNAYFGESVMFDLADGVVGFQSIACFAEGTRIATPEGERAIERLAPGDCVMTVEGSAARVQWVGRRRVDCARHPAPETVWPVEIAAGAFGPGLPARALRLSPDHALYLDGVLIPVKHLIDGHSVVQRALPSVIYYHLELGHHDVVLAEGLPAETYLETGHRAAFANGGPVTEAHPRFAPPEAEAQLIWAAAGYAPLVVSGPALQRARQRLAEAKRFVKPHEPLRGTH